MRSELLIGVLLVAAPAFGEDKKAPAKPADETIDTIMEKATASGDEPAPDRAKPEEKAKPEEGKGDKVATTAKPAAKAKPVIEAAPVTDDNDTTAEAARPKALQPVAAPTQPRRPGPFELGALDCRILDGAGIERLLPEKIITGEEPDLLCRVMVTQPPTVASAPHNLTLSVFLGSEEKYRQSRPVRMSAIGRRSTVFVVPADRISSEELARVTIRVSLSQPAKPATRELKFTVEPAD